MMKPSALARGVLLIAVWFAITSSSLAAIDACFVGPGPNHECTAIMVYEPRTGNVAFNFTERTTALELQSANGRFQGPKPAVLSGLFDQFTPNRLFLLYPFGLENTVDFGPILPSGLTCKQIYEDLDGSTSLYQGGNGGVGFGNLCDGPDPVPNDLDGDEFVNSSDIDIVMRALRSGDPHLEFDFDKSGTFNRDDLRFYVEQRLLTTAGDADVNGRFDSGDLTLVFQAGQYEDLIPENSFWADGDWTADGEFASDDLIAAFQSGAYEQTAARVAAVPEPSGVILGIVTLLSAIGPLRCKRHGPCRS